jgi:hypothetical protein
MNQDAAKEMIEQIRRTLSDRAVAAGSPFFEGQRAYYKISRPVSEYSRIVVMADDEFLPSRRQVEITRLFAFGAVTAGQVITPAATSLIREERSGPQALNLDRLTSGLEGGYSRLVRLATSLLASIGSDLFCTLAEKLVALDEPSNFHVPGGLLIRIGSLTPNDHTRLGELVERGEIDVAVGLDPSQPDLGVQSRLYEEIRHLPEIRKQQHSEYLCLSDQLVTSTLAPGEMTGIFWRYGGRPPAGSSYQVGSCYARLKDRSFAPVRADVVARTGKLQESATTALNVIARRGLVPPNSDLMKDISRRVGSQEATVSELARDVLGFLEFNRKSKASDVDQFYGPKEAAWLTSKKR